MSRCTHCGVVNKPTARFCNRCGHPLLSRGSWLNTDQIIRNRPRSMGLMGAGLTLLGGFLPWATVSVGVFGELSTGAPAAAGLFLLSIIAVATMFHREGGNAAMVVGGICLLTALFALLENPGSSPSLGLLLSLVGGGLVSYAGYQVRV